jgi:hypothetical protein
MATRGNPTMTGVEAQHHFAQTQQVPAAFLFRPKLQWHVSNLAEPRADRQLGSALSKVTLA